jgi:mono/diheme cytochrome c family protein
MISRHGVVRRLAVGACVVVVSLGAVVDVRAQHVLDHSKGPTTTVSPTRAAAAADIAAGEVLYARRCAVCHGPKGEGGRGPTLARATLPRAADMESLLRIIQRGIEDTGMPSSRLTRPEVAQVAAFVTHLGRRPAERVPGNAARGAHRAAPSVPI